jgi:serine/threonine protein kinase
MPFGDRLEFEAGKLLSEKSYFGVVFRARLKDDGSRVAVKQVLLDSGLHYDRANKEYVADGKSWCSAHARKALEPRFHKRRCMPAERFTRECTKMHKLHKLGLAPKVFGFWTERRGPAHFGFLVAELCDGTVKDVITRRALSRSEHELILAVVSRFHDLGYTHGDLKPSNIGVKLDEQDRVSSALLIDCATVRKPKSKRGLRAEATDDDKRYRRRLKEQTKD